MLSRHRAPKSISIIAVIYPTLTLMISFFHNDPRSRRWIPRCIRRGIPRFSLILFPNHPPRGLPRGQRRGQRRGQPRNRGGVSRQRSVQRSVLLQVHSARKNSMYVVVVLHARRRLGTTCVALSTGSVEPLLSIATVVAKVDVSMAHVIMSPSKL
jgi:hypothetical protein